MKHPTTKGLPTKWRHVSDELYDRLRGPAEKLTVLATAYSDKSNVGTGENEPVLFTIHFGKGRVFHTVLRDNVKQINCVDFAVTLQRGADWEATVRVTRALPEKLPSAVETPRVK